MLMEELTLELQSFMIFQCRRFFSTILHKLLVNRRLLLEYKLHNCLDIFFNIRQNFKTNFATWTKLVNIGNFHNCQQLKCDRKC